MTDKNAAIQPGQKIPAATIHIKSEDGIDAIETTDYFKDCRVVMFALPGAFTSTCSAKHLPGYIDQADKLKAAGFDKIACLAVNDANVMRAWSLENNAEGIVDMLSDPCMSSPMRWVLSVSTGQCWANVQRAVPW